MDPRSSRLSGSNVTNPLLPLHTHVQLDENDMGYLSMSPEDIDELETMDAWVAMMAGLEEEEEEEAERDGLTA